MVKMSRLPYQDYSWADSNYVWTYPCCFGDLLAYFYQDLVARVEFMDRWITVGPPPVFWMSAFFFPQVSRWFVLFEFLKCQIFASINLDAFAGVHDSCTTDICQDYKDCNRYTWVQNSCSEDDAWRSCSWAKAGVLYSLWTTMKIVWFALWSHSGLIVSS